MTPSRELKNYIPNLKDFEIYLSIDLAKTVFFILNLFIETKLLTRHYTVLKNNQRKTFQRSWDMNKIMSTVL